MNQIELIKKEIERRYNDNLKAEEMAHTGHFGSAAKEDYDLLSFIESLEKEQDVDLEKELEDWRHKHFKGKRDGDYSGEYLERESQLSIAHYFYELGLNSKIDVPKIKGWVARDKYTGHFIIYNNSDCWGYGLDVINLPGDWRKIDATYEPIEVELTISQVVK